MTNIKDDKMNVIIFLTDQERATQNFPAGWEEENLPGLTRLKKNGLTFSKAFTNSCMCSPARSTFMTGFLPATHGVKYTLEENMNSIDYDQVVLPLPPSPNEKTRGFRNIATVMSDSGYNVVYKGKWHCSKPANSEAGDWTPPDLADYGFGRWNPKDAGANQDLDEAGGPRDKNNQVDQPWYNETGEPNGGDYHNDARFMYDNGGGDREGVMAYMDYLNSDEAKADGKPFCLIISLVNPHDVLFLGNDTFDEAGYANKLGGNASKWTKGDIKLPSTNRENLDNKPEIQSRFLKLSAGLGTLDTDELKEDYVNFYGNLIKSSDAYLVEVLDKLEELKMLDDTLFIRTSDHGEMGLAHGGLRQKNFNFYEESINVPLVYSNPKLFKKAESSAELVSHVDFLPTLASLVGAPEESRDEEWQGIDYSSLIIQSPEGKKETNYKGQDYIVFTYDDWQAGQASAPYAGQGIGPVPVAPNHIVGIREKHYKFAEYYDDGDFSSDTLVKSEYEMYHLEVEEDESEVDNLAYDYNALSDHLKAEYNRLKNQLDEVKASLGIVTKEG